MPETTKSPREQVQDRLVEFLTNFQREGTNWPRFDAPYGVLEGMAQAGNGKVRTVTFGVARYLDACIYVWSPSRITCIGHGALASKCDHYTWHSVEKCIEDLKKI